MFLAHLETATGEMTIGLIDLSQEDLEGPLNALINMLGQVSDPIQFTSTDAFVREMPSDTPATLTFKYLGAKSAKFADQEAFGASMNEHLALGVFQCPSAFEADDAGRITAAFECFELVGEENTSTSAPAIHRGIP